MVLKLGNAKLLGNSFEVVKSIVFFFFSLLFLQTAIIYFIDQNIVGSFNASKEIIHKKKFVSWIYIRVGD